MRKIWFLQRLPLVVRQMKSQSYLYGDFQWQVSVLLPTYRNFAKTYTNPDTEDNKIIPPCRFTQQKTNNMRVRLLFFIFFFGIQLFGQNKQVCISFDDLPVVNYGISDSCYQIDLFNKLVKSLKTFEIPAIGFVNEKKLYNNGNIIQYQVGLLQSWVNNGLDLGNHTFSHPDYNKVSFSEYTSDIIKGETITKEILAKSGKTLKYFRHPFLHVGNTKIKEDSLSNFLDNRGYIIVPVTIDNEDYLFALAYKRAIQEKDSILSKQIGHDYVEYMEKKIRYYEMQANKLFGRNINQILLIHASLLNSDYIDSLVNIYQKNGYVFVSIDVALEDSVYKSNITVYGNWGISWIDKWALSAGKKGNFFIDDPETPNYIKKLAE